MGYYDDHSPTRRNGRSGLLSGLIGGIIGALIVLMLSSVLPGRNEDVGVSTNKGNEDQGLTKNVSLDVTTDVTKAVGKAGKAVVGITNIQTAGFWSGVHGQGAPSQEAGTGSGVIYKKAGGKAFIVTNNHVIEGASQLEVTLQDGTKIPAKIVGTDRWMDLAVVEVDSKSVKDDAVAEFGNSDALKLGEPVIAIGNPLGIQFSGSVTQGIISGLQRTVPVDINGDNVPDWQAEVIQTDAAINPGNSGGALVNIAGQVTGINSMKIAQSAVEGIGFSIPINTAIPVIKDLETYGEVKRAAMGVTLRDVDDISAYHQAETLKLPKDITSGVMIEQVVPRSPAERAGLKELDVIVGLDGEAITNTLELRKHLYSTKKVGDSLKVKYYRSGKLHETTVKLTDESSI